MNENYLNIHDLFLLFAAIECVFLAILLVKIPSKDLQPRYFLAAFFAVTAINLGANLLIWKIELADMLANQTPILISLLVSSILLKGPLLLFYFRSLSHTITIADPKNILYLLPALVALLIILFFNANSVDWRYATSMSKSKKLAIDLIWISIKILPVIFISLCFYTEYKRRENLKQFYSTVNLTEQRLVSVALLALSLHWLWLLIAFALGKNLPQDLNEALGRTGNYLIFLIINSLFVFGIINTRQLLTDIIIKDGSPSSEKLEEHIKAIESGIHEKKLYLEPTINLERFSEKIGVRPRETSAIINSHFNLNFLEFINGYRISEAKRLLALDELKDEPIQTIIYKSGFNSTSSFHRAFKHVVNTTPSEYRRIAFEKTNK